MELKFKILNIFLILAIICSISVVSAIDYVDTSSNDVIEVDDALLNEEVQLEEETLKDSTQYSFKDLATKINSVEGEEVAIEGTYTYDDEKDSD